MRQQAGVGSKVRPRTAHQQGDGRGRTAVGTSLRRAEDGQRRPGGQDRANLRQRDLAPVVSPSESGWGPGRGRGRDRDGTERSSHLPPPGSGLAGTRQPVPPRWPRLLSGSLPGHPARARPPSSYGSPRGPHAGAADRGAGGACAVATGRPGGRGRAAGGAGSRRRAAPGFAAGGSPFYPVCLEAAPPSPGSAFLVPTTPSKLSSHPTAVLWVFSWPRGREFPRPPPRCFGLVESLCVRLKSLVHVDLSTSQSHVQRTSPQPREKFLKLNCTNFNSPKQPLDLPLFSSSSQTCFSEQHLRI